MVQAFEDWIDQHDVAYVTYWNDVDGSGYHGQVSDGMPSATADAARDLFLG